MSIKFNTPAEAFMAVAAVAIAADGVGSMAERKFLYEKVKTLDVFEGMGMDEFNTLCTNMTNHIYDTLPMADMTITVQGIDMLVGAVKAALDTDQQKALLKTVTDLCHADGLSEEEKVLLEHLERGFSLS